MVDSIHCHVVYNGYEFLNTDNILFYDISCWAIGYNYRLYLRWDFGTFIAIANETSQQYVEVVTSNGAIITIWLTVTCLFLILGRKLFLFTTTDVIESL